MATKASPWTEKVIELLSDGEWHDYTLLRDEAARLVPPGVAFREAESNRVRNFIEDGREVQERKYGDKQDTILTGQRAFVTRSIRELRRRGRVEVEYGPQPRRKRPIRVRIVQRGSSDENRQSPAHGQVD